jgi:hypothetical protein
LRCGQRRIPFWNPSPENLSRNAFNFPQLDTIEIGEKNPKGTAPRGPFSFTAKGARTWGQTPINFPENPTESMNYNADFLKTQ